MGFTIPAIGLSSAADASLPIPGSSASVPILLTASALLLAVDATMQAYHGRKQPSQPPVLPSKPAAESTPQPDLTKLVTKTKRILGEVQDLEQQLSAKRTRRHPPPKPSSHFVTRPQATRQGGITCVVETESNKSVSPEFSSLCERLLLVNQIKKQEKELKTLRTSEKELKREHNDKAFSSFCDQLLFWNKVWKLEREVKELVENGERLKRNRIAAITTAAKRMVDDVQKERMVGELVKDMNDEINGYKDTIEEMKSEHEKEILEVHGEWLKDYMGLRRELESLRVAQTARLAEQALSNDLEDSLVERMKAGQQKVEELEAKLAEYEEASDEMTDTAVDSSSHAGDLTLVDFDNFDDDGETTDVELSELSTSSTCVSASARKITIPLPSRKRVVSFGTSKGSLLFSTTLTDSKPGFDEETVVEYKPIVVDSAASKAALTASLASLTRSCNHSGSGRPQAVLHRCSSISSLKRPNSLNNGGVMVKSGGVMKPRAPWRV